MSVLPACASVYQLPSWCQWRAEEGTGSPGTEITDLCELPGGCLALSLAVLLTAKPPLQPVFVFKF